MDLKFCFRISPEAGMAYDTITGAPCAAYLQVKMDAQEAPQDYDQSHREIGHAFAKQNGWPAEWFEPISIEVYDLEADNDDDEEEGGLVEI